MDIQNEIAAIQNRIAEITQIGTPPPAPAPNAGSFSALVSQALNPTAAVDAAPATGNAISSPLSLVNPAAPYAQPLTGGAAPVFSWPTSGTITSPFGDRPNPFGSGTDFHPGIDIAADEGTAIRAAADGRVISSGPDGGYGNAVVIDHGAGLTTKYGHCSQLYATVGQTVRAGDPIAAVGSTGHSTGPHLHFEADVDGKPVDPQRFLR